MRTEQEMYGLIKEVALKDERIRAVYMNGSRANPNAKRDIFQDFDIVYVVTETESFIQDKSWTSIFGSFIISQEPDKLDKMLGQTVDFSRSYTYLMQFQDGNRIDLHLEIIDEMLKEYGKDTMTVPLLDKDGCLFPISPTSDEGYRIKRPDFGMYFSRCNNFWWVAPYCAKGLWRNEILYTCEMLNSWVRKELMQMLSWYVGIQTDFKVNLGTGNKWLQQYISEDWWKKLMLTYNLGDYESAWTALINTCELFEEVAPIVGKSLEYEYNEVEANQSFAFIMHIKALPK